MELGQLGTVWTVIQNAGEVKWESFYSQEEAEWYIEMHCNTSKFHVEQERIVFDTTMRRFYRICSNPSKIAFVSQSDYIQWKAELQQQNETQLLEKAKELFTKEELQQLGALLREKNANAVF